MNNLKDISAAVLDCGYMEVMNLMESEIDVCETVKHIKENGEEVNMENIYETAFYDKIYDLFHKIPNYENDFTIEYNGCATDIILSGDKWDWYYDNYPDKLRELEKYMGISLEEGASHV